MGLGFWVLVKGFLFKLPQRGSIVNYLCLYIMVTEIKSPNKNLRQPQQHYLEPCLYKPSKSHDTPNNYISSSQCQTHTEGTYREADFPCGSENLWPLQSDSKRLSLRLATGLRVEHIHCLSLRLFRQGFAVIESGQFSLLELGR